jgi:hypothetical protein
MTLSYFRLYEAERKYFSPGSLWVPKSDQSSVIKRLLILDEKYLDLNDVHKHHGDVISWPEHVRSYSYRYAKLVYFQILQSSASRGPFMHNKVVSRSRDLLTRYFNKLE